MTTIHTQQQHTHKEEEEEGQLNGGKKHSNAPLCLDPSFSLIHLIPFCSILTYFYSQTVNGCALGRHHKHGF